MSDADARAIERAWLATNGADEARQRLIAVAARGALPEDVIERRVAERSARSVQFLADVKAWGAIGTIADNPATDAEVVVAAFQAAIRPWGAACLEMYTKRNPPASDACWIMRVTHLGPPKYAHAAWPVNVRYACVSIMGASTGRSGARTFSRDRMIERVGFVTRMNPIRGVAFAFIVLRPSPRGAPGDILPARGHRGPAGFDPYGNVFAADNGLACMTGGGPMMPCCLAHLRGMAPTATSPAACPACGARWAASAARHV